MTDQKGKLALLEGYRREGGAGRYRRFKMVIGGEVHLDLDEVATAALGATSMILTLKDHWGTLYVVEREAYPSVMEYMAKKAKEQFYDNPNDLPVT